MRKNQMNSEKILHDQPDIVAKINEKARVEKEKLMKKQYEEGNGTIMESLAIGFGLERLNLKFLIHFVTLLPH